MKIKFVLLFTASILICISSFSQLPLIIEENCSKPLITLSVNGVSDTVHLKTTITKNGYRVIVDYKWNCSRQAFEERQNAKAGIMYRISVVRNAGGLNEFITTINIPSSDMGSISFLADSRIIGEMNKGVKGPGIYFVLCECVYKDKDGKRHKGRASNQLILYGLFSE